MYYKHYLFIQTIDLFKNYIIEDFPLHFQFKNVIALKGKEHLPLELVKRKICYVLETL